MIEKDFFRELKANRQLHTLIILPLLYLVVFKYLPYAGLQIAFKNFVAVKGIWGSPWAGMKHLTRFVTSYQFFNVIGNTLILSFYQLLATFPFPIILALSVNYVRGEQYKKTVQMITYAPHFISVVVLVGMINQFFGSRIGMINHALTAMGGSSIDFLGNPANFRHLYVWSAVWQNVGYSSIIYIAALSAIAPELHEAAIVDGAGILSRIRHVDIPGILPTAAILLIMQAGQVLNIGFEKAFLMQNPMNIENSEIIATYVYKIGLGSTMPNFSYSTAIGLFQSVVAFLMLISVNAIARRVGETSLW